jgi:aspartate racemase
MKTVGILGGMGPEATVLLMQKVINSVDAKDDGHHIPMVVHQNTQVPSRILRILESEGEDPSPILQRMALDLQNLQCDFLAMPCNTAHYYHSTIAKTVRIPLLNMIELSVQQLSQGDLKKIGILASPAVKAVGVFDKSFEKRGLKFQFSINDSNMLNMIKNIKRGKVGPSVIDAFSFESSQLLNAGCDALLIACTELSLLRKYLPPSVICVDSLDSLTEKIVSLAIDAKPISFGNC